MGRDSRLAEDHPPEGATNLCEAQMSISTWKLSKEWKLRRQRATRKQYLTTYIEGPALISLRMKQVRDRKIALGIPWKARA
jgi:hypothetical protein